MTITLEGSRCRAVVVTLRGKRILSCPRRKPMHRVPDLRTEDLLAGEERSVIRHEVPDDVAGQRLSVVPVTAMDATGPPHVHRQAARIYWRNGIVFSRRPGRTPKGRPTLCVVRPTI